VSYAWPALRERDNSSRNSDGNAESSLPRLHDEHGDALHTIRYGRMPPEANSVESYTHRDVHRMMRRVLEDVLALRRRAGPMPVVLRADGAPELWRRFAQNLNAETLGVEATELIVWPGAFRQWKTWLLLEPRGAARVVDALERAGMHNARDESGRRCAHRATPREFT
jgi:hypothetical protein